MQYIGYFKDIDMTSYGVQIITQGTPTQQEITLCDNPVIIETNSSGLFSPIKSRSCTINILSGVGMFDLYTTNPLGVQVSVWNRNTNEVIFFGYATPCQYNQSWTTLDTISLDCVDVVSVLKQIKYKQIDNKLKKYQKLSWILGWCLVQGGEQSYKIYIPKNSLSGANNYSAANIQYLLENVYINEANFFDDDNEKTPWTCYEVLEEVCRFLGMSLVPVNTPGNDQDHYWALVDYVNVANSSYGTYTTLLMSGNYTIFNGNGQHTYTTQDLSKSMSISQASYAGGSPDLSMDDVYNVIEIETNRYDIDEIAEDMMDEDKHVSITKEKNFGGAQQVWTYYYGNWWAQIGIGTGWQQIRKYLFHRWCRLAYQITGKTLWKHYWYIPNELSAPWGSYYSQTLGSEYQNLPQNKYINCLGATFIHYCALDNLSTKPTKLDWNDAIMFLLMNDKIRGTGANKDGGFLMPRIYDFETKALEYDSDYEMNFAPYSGKSWIVFSGKLLYQQNHSYSGNELKIVNETNHTFVMDPLEDVANVEPYNFNILTGGVPTFYTFSRRSNHADFGKGFKLMKAKLQIGNKYWNGSAWTTTQSYFYLPFSSIYQEDDQDREGFRAFEWMDMVSNTTYEDKVGANGYCIPVEPTDDVCGQIHVELFNPTIIPHDTYNGQTYLAAILEAFPSLQTLEQRWSDYSPVVFMKDFKIDYAYTDETEWYLAEEIKTDDLKYKNEVNTIYELPTNDEVKVNSWQEKRPISKSYPIVNVSGSGRQFLVSTKSPFDGGQFKQQEYELIDKRFRHYQAPHKVYECNIKSMLKPWARVSLTNGSGLNSGVYVVDSQSFDVRNRNNRVKLIEFGDSEIHNS